MKKVNELLDQMKPMRAEVKKRCISYLKRTLKKAKDNRLEFYDENGDSYGNEFVSVTYDGGGHPGYGSSCYNTVYGIYLAKNDSGKEHILLSTEEDDEYPIEYITWDDLVCVTDYVYKVLMPILKKG